MSVCASGASSTIIRIKKTILFYEKGKLKYLGSYCLLCQEKIRQQRNLSLTVFKWSGKEHTDIGGEENIGEMGEKHTGCLFHLNIRWLSWGMMPESSWKPPPGLTAFVMRTLMALIWPENKNAVVVVDAGESGPRSDTSGLLKEQNHNFAERFTDSKLIAKYSWVIFYTF